MGSLAIRETSEMQSALTARRNNRDRTNAALSLPLGAFERYMLADDRSDYPMAFVISIDVTGELCREAFNRALSSTLDRHPLLTAIVRRDCFGRRFWVPQSGLRPWLDWREDKSDLSCPRGDRIDLSRESGIRIWIRKQPGQSRITFQFHHATTDGLGGMQFIGDLLALYGMETLQAGQESPKLEPVDTSLLALRTLTGNSISRWKMIKLAAQEFFHLLRRVPACIALPRRDDSQSASSVPFPAFLTRTFSRDVNMRLKDLAARKSVTPNDLLLLAMFRTIREWNRIQDAVSGRTLLRIGIPVTLRTPRHDLMPAANVLSYLFVDQAERPDDDDEALQSIHRRTELIMNGATAAAFTTGIGIGLGVPGLVPATLRLSPCFASVILANVGDVKRQFRATFPLKKGKIIAGNIQLEALVGAAPVRRNTRVAVSLGVYAGTLFVNIHCDPKCFAHHEAEVLADLFADNIRAMAMGTLDWTAFVASSEVPSAA